MLKSRVWETDVACFKAYLSHHGWNAHKAKAAVQQTARLFCWPCWRRRSERPSEWALAGKFIVVFPHKWPVNILQDYSVLFLHEEPLWFSAVAAGVISYQECWRIWLQSRQTCGWQSQDKHECHERPLRRISDFQNWPPGWSRQTFISQLPLLPRPEKCKISIFGKRNWPGRRDIFLLLEEILKIYDLQKEVIVKPMRKLTRKHVFPNNIKKINVKRALEIFSPSVMAALEFLRGQAGHSCDYSFAEQDQQ